MKTCMLAVSVLLLTSASVFAQDPPYAANDVTVVALSNAAEPGTSGAFRFTFVQAKQQPCLISFTTSGVTPAGNYVPLSGTVQMPGGGATTTVDVPVTPVDNAVVDGTRNVNVTVTGTDCSSIDPGTPNQATVTIADNDATLTVIKSVVGGSAIASDWTMEVTNSIPAQNSSFPGAASPGTNVVIAAGSYNVVESGGPGGDEVYNPSLGAGCSGSIVAGATASCTITNTFVPPTTTTTTAVPTTTTTAAPTTTTTAAPTTTTTAAPTTTTTAAPTTTTTAAPTTTTTAGSTTTTTAGSTTTTTAGSTTTTTAAPTTTTTAAPTTTTTAAPTTTTTAAPTTTTTAAPTTTTTAAPTTTTTAATTTTTTTATPTTTTTLPPLTPALTLVKTADPSTFDMAGVLINYSYLVSSTGNTAVIGPITVTDSRMTVTCPPVNSVGNNDGNLDIGESLICTSSLITNPADVVLGYIITSSVAEGANASSDPVETSVPYATGGVPIPTLSEWAMIILSFLLLLMGVGYFRKQQTV